MTSFLSYLINGISLGSVYAIIALGYTMVYGIAKMLNFAHGESGTYIENIIKENSKCRNTRLPKVEINRDKLRFKKRKTVHKNSKKLRKKFKKQGFYGNLGLI